jgi:hypothetical protein
MGSRDSSPGNLATSVSRRNKKVKKHSFIQFVSSIVRRLLIFLTAPLESKNQAYQLVRRGAGLALCIDDH